MYATSSGAAKSRRDSQSAEDVFVEKSLKALERASSVLRSSTDLEGAEEQASLRPPFVKPEWVPDSEALACHRCMQVLTRGQHHCRNCGKVFCHPCCHAFVRLLNLNYDDPQRCCQDCIKLYRTVYKAYMVDQYFHKRSVEHMEELTRYKEHFETFGW